MIDPTGYSGAFNRVQSVAPTGENSALARKEMADRRWEHLFSADWKGMVFVHYAIVPELLQPHVPFPLHLYEGKAYVSLVAFTMRDLCFARGGTASGWLTRPIANHSFLNLRTYVEVDGVKGIHFLTEWLDSRIACALGPATFGLPYRYAKLEYDRNYRSGTFDLSIAENDSSLSFSAEVDPGSAYEPCKSATLDEFLLERYTAFNCLGRWRSFFRVWHEPWAQKPLSKINFANTDLLDEFPWADGAELIGGHASPGVEGVWMSRPHLYN